MNILRKIVSLLVLAVSIFVMVCLCMKYDWSGFSAVFKNFKFDELANQIYWFFLSTHNAIVLILVSFIGLTMPGKKK